MIKLYTMKNHLLFILCAMTIMACATLPMDTLNKRLGAFEITYGQVLITLNQWIEEKRLDPEQKLKAQELVKKISAARTSIYIAKGVNDLTKAQTQLNAASTLLTALREMLVVKENMNQ